MVKNPITYAGQTEPRIPFVASAFQVRPEIGREASHLRLRAFGSEGSHVDLLTERSVAEGLLAELGRILRDDGSQ